MIESSATSEQKPPDTLTNAVDLHVASVVKPKYDWYQTEVDVVLTILLKDVPRDNVKLAYGEASVSVSITQPGKGDFSLELDLAHPIVPAKCTFSVLKPKVEVHLRKRDGGRWTSLEGDGKPPVEKLISVPASADDKLKTSGESTVRKYPTSSHAGPKNWDKIEREVKEEEEKEPVEGDAAVNRLFQKIFADSNDDVKKAMMKSYSESGGTVLSTNWDDIKKGKVECKPPDGMEWKKW